MTPLEGEAIKAIGAVTGSALALTYLPPRTWKGFFKRAGAGIAFGYVFAPYVREWAHFGLDWEGRLGSATLAGLISWWAMDTIIRIVRAWKGPKAADD
jgi:hypothetical protein